jgi:hypothetical protein
MSETGIDEALIGPIFAARVIPASQGVLLGKGERFITTRAADH